MGLSINRGMTLALGGRAKPAFGPELILSNFLDGFAGSAGNVVINSAVQFTTPSAGTGVTKLLLEAGKTYRVSGSGATTIGACSINTANAGTPTARTLIGDLNGTYTFTAVSGSLFFYLRNDSLFSSTTLTSLSLREVL